MINTISNYSNFWSVNSEEYNISDVFIELDEICDCIPLISTLSNIVVLFHKIVIQPSIQYFCPGEIKNRYWSHIEKKSGMFSFLLLFPVLLPQAKAFHIHTGEDLRIKRYLENASYQAKKIQTVYNDRISRNIFRHAKIKDLLSQINKIETELYAIRPDLKSSQTGTDSDSTLTNNDTLNFLEENALLLHPSIDEEKLTSEKKKLFSRKTPSKHPFSLDTIRYYIDSLEPVNDSASNTCSKEEVETLRSESQDQILKILKANKSVLSLRQQANQNHCENNLKRRDVDKTKGLIAAYKFVNRFTAFPRSFYEIQTDDTDDSEYILDFEKPHDTSLEDQARGLENVRFSLLHFRDSKIPVPAL